MLFQLVLIQVITFIAIVLVLRKLLYTETTRETNRLKLLTEENYKKEKELAEKIKQADAAYKERITRAEEDVRKLKEEGEEKLEEMRKGATDKAKEEAGRIIKEAINAKEKIRDEIKNEMQEKAPALAAQIFRDFLSAKIKEITHKELFRAVVNEVKKADKARFNVKVKKGELLSAFPLARNEKNELLSAVSKKVGRKITFNEKEDKNLVAGVVIKLNTLVIDGSLENRLYQLEQRRP